MFFVVLIADDGPLEGAVLFEPCLFLSLLASFTSLPAYTSCQDEFTALEKRAQVGSDPVREKAPAMQRRVTRNGAD